MLSFTERVPRLNFDHYKGEAGRIAVIGGCLEYTGAPFFAGSSILKLGGDLSHIFCSKSAAVPIKAYQPEQIVHPYLPDNDELDYVPTAVKRVEEWFPAIHSVVIGPGLGRNVATTAFTKLLLPKLAASEKPVIVDGDALFLVSQDPSIVQGCKNFILTPNVVELSRIATSIGMPANSPCKDIAAKLGGVTIFSKGKKDVISDGSRVESFEFGGSPRRVGGQGDILAGALGLFSFWSKGDYFAACAAASEAVRSAAKLAFAKNGRSEITSDIINELSHVIPQQWNQVE